MRTHPHFFGIALAVAGSITSALPRVCSAQAAEPAPREVIRVRVPVTFVENPAVPHSEVASVVDSHGVVHLVFTQPNGGTEDLYYVRVVESTVSPPVRVTSLGMERVRHAHVAIDDAGTLHIAFWVKRDADGPTNTGNFGVYYARGGSAGFAVEQVSENPSQPADNTQHTFNAYVNDRPRVFFDAAGQSVIEYLSFHADGPQGHGNYVVFATRAGAGWQREQAFMPVHGNSVGDGIAVPRRWAAVRQVAYYDIDQYHPHLATFANGRWNDQVIDGPGGYTNLDEVAFDYDSHGVGHLTWIAKRDRLFVHRRVDGTTVGPLEQTTLSQMPWSNFAPTAIDPVTDRVWFLYEDSTSDTRRERVLVPGAASGAYTEVGVPTLNDVPGVIYGSEALWVRDGRAYVVTGSQQAGTVFVTMFRGP